MIYLVGVRGEQVEGLAHPLGLGTAYAVDDTENMLPQPYRVKKLTAVVVKTDGTRLRECPARPLAPHPGRRARADPVAGARARETGHADGKQFTGPPDTRAVAARSTPGLP